MEEPQELYKVIYFSILVKYLRQFKNRKRNFRKLLRKRKDLSKDLRLIEPIRMRTILICLNKAKKTLRILLNLCMINIII